MMKSLDIILGFALVMLVTSMAVTVLTQIGTALLETRGSHLRDGLASLLNQLHAELSPPAAQAIVEHVLRNPLVRDSPSRLGSLIHRDELIRLLLEAATGSGPRPLEEFTRKALLTALAHSGIPDPAATLHAIRQTALQIEIENPQLAAAARHDLAILHAAQSDFVAKMNGWFDQTVDRISARFTLTTRRITAINAFLVVLALQMDTVALVNRLGADAAFRDALVSAAPATETSIAAPAGDMLARLAPPPLLSQDWVRFWNLKRVPGLVLSVLLLSLGAPFWFEVLKNILRLRSLIALKDDTQRSRRS